MTTTKIQQAAAEARTHFEKAIRDNQETFWSTKEGRPEWVQDLCREAHGDFWPDDWRYAFIVEALDALEEHDDADEARDSLEADIYTAELTGWLASSVQRPGYVDEAAEEFGSDTSGIVAAIQMGQLAEKWETFDLVRAFLESRDEEESEEA